MRTRSPKRTAILIAAAFVCLAWWWMSWDFSDQFVAGKYVATSNGERNVLILTKDHRFTQQVSIDNKQTIQASGTWHRFGEGGIAFSNAFIEASPTAVRDSNVYGLLDNHFGLWTLVLNPRYKDRWKFHKLWFL